MTNILCIETSTEVCSVSLSCDEKQVAIMESEEGNNHSSLLGVYIDNVLHTANMSPKQLDAVAVSMGPGSYTGLRIGVSMAKGLCYGLNIPLIAISTLQTLSESVSDVNKDFDFYCPMIDARRMEVYTAVYDSNNVCLEDISAKIIDNNSFSDFKQKGRMAFFGNGAGKTSPIISNDACIYMDGIKCSASHLIKSALRKFKSKDFVDTAYFEPYYLKDFIATTPKHIIL